MKHILRDSLSTAEKTKRFNHLVWTKQEYRPPNENYWCTIHTFWVLGEKIANVEGPSIAVRAFRVRGCRLLFDTLQEAEVSALKKFRSETKSQIKRLQELSDSLVDYKAEAH